LQTPEELAGRPVRCPACRQVQVVPAAAVRDEPLQEIQVEPRRRPPALPDDDEDIPPRTTATSRKAVWSLVLGISSFCLSIFTGVPAVIFGALALRDINRSHGNMAGSGLAIGGIVAGACGIVLVCPLIGVALLVPAIQKVQDAALQTQAANNLKQITLAMHNYQSTFNCLPPAAGGFEGGQPMDPGLSWRVALLPFLEEEPRYGRFKLDEPWDSATNKPLLEPTPMTYRYPDTTDPPGTTRYRLFVGADTPCVLPTGRRPARGRSLTDFPNGISNTILIAEASPVPWSKPDELPFSPDQPLPKLQVSSRGYTVAMADGSVRYIPVTTPEAELRGMISAGGPPKKRGR
jgi:type II secretory pathway pseudopilin PulG